MSTDVNSASSSSSFIDSLRWDKRKEAENQEPNDKLDQEDFFSLLTQQLSFQDPTKPADNDQMIAQMTSFTMAEGISDLNKNFDSLAASMTSNSALQASTLIGKKALLESSHIETGPGALSKGSAIVGSPVDKLLITIYDDKDQVVRQMDMGKQAAGPFRFEWDGKNTDGDAMPAGDYKIKVEGSVKGEFTTFPTATFRNIDSVNVNGANGVVVNTKEGAVRISDVAEIA